MLGPHFWHPLLLILFQILLASCLKKNSLTFVIDDTISMDPVIEAAKKASVRIMDQILNVSSSQIEDVVVVTFNDPDTKLWTKSRNRNSVIEALASIYAHTDKSYNPCPEYAMSGVYLGLNNSLPGSTLFTFTDSDAEDKYLDSSVIDLCQKMQSRVNFIITKGYCMNYPDVELKVYYKVAKACSGKVMYLNVNELDEVFKLVDIFVQGTMTTLVNFNFPPNPLISRKQFTIDDQVEYVLITATGSSRELTVSHNSHAINGKRVIWLENVKVIQLNNPTPGNYLVEIRDHAHIQIEIEGRTDFTFEHGFSQRQPKTMEETTAQPIRDTKNYLSILVSDPTQAVSIKEVELFSLQNKTIMQIPLKNMAKNFYITEPFISPSYNFRISVNGVVKKSGRDISRFAKVPVAPQPKPKVIPDKKPQVKINEGDKIETKYGSSITLTCEVSAYPKPAIYWKNSNGVILSKDFSLKLEPYDYVSYLNLNQVKKSEQISCHADNKLLSTKKSIHVEVRYFDINAQLPVLTEVQYGTAKTIKCDIQSQLPMRTRWYFQKDATSSKVSLSSSSSLKVSADGKELTVLYMDKDQNGKYLCEATLVGNELEKETLQTELKVVGLKVPVIQKNHKLYHALVNTSTTLACKISQGTPKPRLIWQRKSENTKWVKLSYAGEELHIPNVELKHTGIYKCVAENTEGVDQFDIKLIVNAPPVIESDRSSYEVKAGALYMKISCIVTGHPTPKITWHEGENLISNGGNYTIQHDGLVIRKPQENEALNLTCGATNSFGYDSKVFELSVYQAPKIDKSVNLVKTFVNTLTTINCKLLNGTPKPNVTWQWRPKNSTWTPLSHIGDKLQLSAIGLSQAGDYKCTAENKHGVDTFETTLVVQSPPIIVSNKTEYIGVLGDSYLRIACKVIGYPEPTVHWLKENETVILGGNYSVDEGDLLISNPQEMETKFTCKATNEFGKDSKTYDVSVYYYLKDYGEKKYIYTKTDDTPSEDAKKFTCPIPHKSPESIRWFTDGFSNNITGPILKINKYTDSNHTCRLADKHSSISYTFVLDIGYPPKFTNTETIIEWTGSDEVINCELEAKPKAKIEWYFNNKKIDESDEFVVTRPISYGWGNYTCKATNVHNYVEKTTTVKSEDCLIKRFQPGLNTPLIVKKISEYGKTTLSWPKYELGNDFFSIASKDTITFSCASDGVVLNYFNLFPGINEIEAVCDHQDSFIFNGSIYKTSELSCNKEVKPTIVNTGDYCYIEGIDKLEVGFKANNFVKAYEVCYDSKRAMIHSSHINNGTWGEIINTSGYSWYQYPGISKRHDSELYNCSATVSSCCYAKSQLLSADVESYSNITPLSTYIENVNAVPEWRPCNKNSVWEALKERISNVLRDTESDTEIVFGASYTSKSGLIPKYLWELLILKGEMKLAMVYVNQPNPVDEDILCKTPCKGDYYEWLNLIITEKSTFCCNIEEYFEKFTPQVPNGYID